MIQVSILVTNDLQTANWFSSRALGKASIAGIKNKNNAPSAEYVASNINQGRQTPTISQKKG